MDRSHFLALGSSLAASVAARPPLAPVNESDRLERALVLSGGGARGAYQAGIIDALVKRGGISDGEPLRPYGIVCGTSIGAINGYFVATGQYSELRNLWYHIAEQHVIRLKRRYAAILDRQGGVVSRIAAATRLVLSLSSHDRGVVDGDHVREWLAARIDPSRRVLMPVVWTVTNLSTQSPEFFYLIDRQLSSGERTRASTAIRDVVGRNAVLREATAELLVDALRASTAIPVAFDPVSLPKADGSRDDLYVDGSVTANTPIAAARAAARNLDVVLMDPQTVRENYNNAFEIGFGVVGAMQRRILEADLRAAFLEGNVNMFQIRPKDELPVGAIGFDQREELYATYKAGFEAALAGFQPYAFS